MSNSVLSSDARIGIANRGEPAVRAVRAIRDFNSKHGAALEAVAFYIDSEADAPFVLEADSAYPLSSFPAARDGGASYMNRDLLVEAFTQTGCKAVWVGWGFLSEEADFVSALEEAGLVFLGPPSQPMSLLGDKIAAKELAERSEVPVVPWSNGPVSSLEEARSVAERIGYPVIVKAANAGGGRGIRFVHTEEDLERQYRSAQEETQRVTGGEVVFIERLVRIGRHLEVQCLADRHGTVRTFGVRDCSVQRRNQKIIEETPPPQLSDEQVEEIEAAAARLLEAAGYQSAGTVEFLYDVERSEFYFMEVNTRLQVEHPITEELYGIDLVQGQIRVAMGERLDELDVQPRGAVLEARLNAEDPDNGFAPSPGTVTLFRAPAGPGIRVDSGIDQGSAIPPEFDSMVAKIIAAGADRDEAISRLRRALSELRVRIEGGTTNRAFLLNLLQAPEVRAGGVHTRFVEEFVERQDDVVGRTRWDLALLAAAVERYLAQTDNDLVNFKQQLAYGSQPRDVSVSRGAQVPLKIGRSSFPLEVRAMGADIYHVVTEEGIVPVRYERRDREAFLYYEGVRHRVQTVERGDALQCEIDDVPYLVHAESSGYVRAGSPAMVLQIHVSAGDQVAEGDVLVSLEAMKMEMLVSAPEPGTVSEILARSGEQVAAGQALVKVESAESEESDGAAESGGERSVRLAVPEQTLDEQWDTIQREFHAPFLGYDHRFGSSETFERLDTFVEQHEGYGGPHFEVMLEAVTMYADIEQLFSTTPIQVEGFARPASFLELLGHYYRREVDREQGLPEEFLSALRRALAWYPGAQDGDTERQRRAIFRMYRSHAELQAKRELLRRTLFALEAYSVSEERHEELADVLDRVAVLCRSDVPALADAAIHSRYVLLDRNILNTLREEKRAKVGRILDLILKHDLDTSVDARHVRNILDTGHHVLPELLSITLDGDTAHRGLAADILGKRFTRDREFTDGRLREDEDFSAYRVQSLDSAGRHETQLYCADGARAYSAIERVLAAHGAGSDGAGQATAGGDGTGTAGSDGRAAEPAEVILLIRVRSGQPTTTEFAQALEGQPLSCRWLTLGVMDESGHQRFRTFFPEQAQAERASALLHEPSLDDVNPIQRRELRMQRLKNFRCRQVYGSESVFVMHATAVENERDERFIAFVDVPTARMELDEDGTIRRMVGLENVFMEAVYAMRAEQAKRRRRLYWNRIVLHIRAVLSTTLNQIREYAGNLAARTGDLGIEQLVAFSRRPAQSSAGNGAQGSTESAAEHGLPAEEVELVFENISGGSFTLRRRAPSEEPLQPMDDYVARVVRARQRGTVYPYEILKMMTRSGYPVTETFPKGDFEEFDLEVDEQTGSSRAVSVKGRPYGQNSSNVVFGIVNNVLPTHPGGVKRVLILSDTTRDMGSLAEPECRRIIAALDLAEERSLPVEWLPISAGARIDMQSGTENLDWTAATLRRIVEFTQAGGEINVIVAGINVGAQSYWNAEATMLMHTRGLLIMTEEAGMLLTGKKALDFSGSVSAESNVGIGGLKRIMGPNGQAQIGATNLYEAYRILFRHYSLTYVQPGERFPRRLDTGDPMDRNISVEPYEDTLGQGFEKIGDIFSNETNPGRKKPFDTRQVMEAVVDRDAETLERWRDMRDAETAVCWEARLGGYATGLIGIESRSLTRIGEVPHDGPTSWTGGTLFPLSSKKVARAINAASGKLPMVILANLSGFDGSPESLRKLQLEFGAEIGRAVVNFQGPLIFVVTARYHGGAYVVFSKMLNENLHAVALSGTYASVIGGAPAAAVVFPRVVKKNTAADPRVVEAERKLQEGEGMSQGEYEDLFQEVYAEKQSELAREFDSVHSVKRAKQVGSIDEILEPDKLRPYLIQVIEKGMQNASGGAER